MKRVLVLIVAFMLISSIAFSEGLPSVYYSLDGFWQIGDFVRQDGIFAICVNDAEMVPYWEFLGYTDYDSDGNPENYPTNCVVLDLSLKNICDSTLKGAEVSEFFSLTTVGLPSEGDELDIEWNKFDFSGVPLEYLTPYGVNTDYDAIKVTDGGTPWNDMQDFDDIEILPGETVQLIFLQSILAKDDIIAFLAPVYLEIGETEKSQKIQIYDPGVYFSDESGVYSEYVLRNIRGKYSCVDAVPIEEWVGQPSRMDLCRYTKTFQESVGLSTTGDLDWETIRWLDYKLYEWENTGK